MTTSYHPTATDVTHGIPDDAVADLTPEARDAVITLLARVSERSYRRGVQQGVSAYRRRPADLPRDLHDWRYGPSTDLSIWADFHMQEPSVTRLFTENGGLNRLGLWQLPMSPTGNGG